MPVPAPLFRAALGRWTTGVTVLTSRAGDRVHGMTVSAFSSVSLEPPLVLVCAALETITLEVIEASGVFAVNLLAAGQRELSDRFASKEWELRRFEGLEWCAGVTGAPLLPGTVASLDCRVVASHGAGDHVIYVGEVVAAQLGSEEPLVYHAGAYRSLVPRG